MKTFSFKQVSVLVLSIVAGIAFIETSSPMWTLAFWREFLLKLLIYGVVSEFVLIIFGQIRLFNERNDS